MNRFLKAFLLKALPTPIIHKLVKARNNFREKRSEFIPPISCEPSVSYDKSFLTFEWLLKEIQKNERSDLSLYFTSVADNIKPSICTTSENYRYLADIIISIASSNEITLKYAHRGKMCEAISYEDLISKILHSSFVEFHYFKHGKRLMFRFENWRHDENKNALIAPRANPYTRQIFLDDTESLSMFFNPKGQNLSNLFLYPMESEPTFDIDLVYTWVNNTDPNWQALFQQYNPFSDHTEERAPEIEEESADRFTSRDELKYSLRSVLKYANWIRKVYIVSNCKPPSWLDVDSNKLQWVYHQEIMNTDSLPTFSSHAIEASIHKIAGLSEHFIYFNDDLFFTKLARKSDFFLGNGLAKIRLEGYGMVHGKINEEDPDYLNAARNGQKLLELEFGKTVTQLHTHTPQSMRLSVTKALEQRFKEDYLRTRSERFRQITDISPTSFLYPHYAYLSGNAVIKGFKSQLIKYSMNYSQAYKNILKSMEIQDESALPLILCINDGGGSALDESWNSAIVDFLDAAFPERSALENSI